MLSGQPKVLPRASSDRVTPSRVSTSESILGLALKEGPTWNIDWAVTGAHSQVNMCLRLVRTGIATLAAGLAATAANAADQPTASAMVCTNPISGASWEIRIDFARGTVDSSPARISNETISWHDATDGGHYTLDRKSGNLTVVFASSTGGYFLHDRCKLETAD